MEMEPTPTGPRDLFTVEESHRMGEAGIPEYWIVDLAGGVAEVLGTLAP
jgi:hypothetical protein